MCDVALIQEIEEGTGGDSKTLRRAIGQIMRTVNAIRDNMQKQPTVEQVNKIVETGLSIHIKSCDAARDDKQEKEQEHNRLKLLGGKFGLEAEGKPGVLVGLFVGLGVGVGGLLLLLMAKAHVWAWIKSLVAQ